MCFGAARLWSTPRILDVADVPHSENLARNKTSYDDFSTILHALEIPSSKRSVAVRRAAIMHHFVTSSIDERDIPLGLGILNPACQDGDAASYVSSVSSLAQWRSGGIAQPTFFTLERSDLFWAPSAARSQDPSRVKHVSLGAIRCVISRSGRVTGQWARNSAYTVQIAGRPQGRLLARRVQERRYEHATVTWSRNVEIGARGTTGVS